MVAGLQHDATVSRLKLLELERAVSFSFPYIVRPSILLTLSYHATLP
jgi:hypothetical protein